MTTGSHRFPLVPGTSGQNRFPLVPLYRGEPVWEPRFVLTCKKRLGTNLESSKSHSFLDGGYQHRLPKHDSAPYCQILVEESASRAPPLLPGEIPIRFLNKHKSI
jgi:hypothetical protein